jgi:putative DNA primase/helicase
VTLSQDHRDYLLAAAITPEVIDASGIHTREKEPRGIVFPWNDGHQDEPLPQLRPDVPKEDDKGRPIKYRFPAGAKMILNRLRDCGDGPALIVEGTKQQYAALSHAPEDHAVYGLSGCWSWVDADLTWAMDRDVYVLFDGDVTTNKDVHQAATEFAEKLDLSGARSVRYVRTTARGRDGLDDVLAKLPEDKRAQYLGLWISKATDKLPKAPAKKDANPFFEKGSLQAEKAARALLERQPAALTVERKVALYLGGSYHIDGTAFLSAVSKQLGDQFRPAWRATLEEMAVGLLFDGGKVLPERSAFAELNCLNGMLNLRTLELKSHDPDYFSTVQVPVEWDPDARAPHYERWLMSVCPLQVDDLEEVAGTMLDPTRTPHKAAFLFGPSRSGKSTFLRILQAIAGVNNRTAVTLHDLSRDRFAAANVYGKILNSAADLSSAHVDDLSVFKMMTGEDPIHGNRKYGTQFTFTNRALFAFSANELPTVSESSRAYAERVKPFEFPHSFAGREDPAIEPRIMQELPGILVRWVKAYARVLERGGYTQTDAAVRREFETRSDRVAQWVADVCLITEAAHGQNLPDSKATGRRESARAFNTWAERNGGSKMGERKIFDRLGHIPGVVEVRAGRNRARAFNIVVKDDPNADLGFSPEGEISRAERAVSEHPAHITSPSLLIPASDPVDLGSGGGAESYGKGASKLPVLPAPSADLDVRNTRPAIALGFDLETAAAEELFTGKHEGPFVRLTGSHDGEHDTISHSPDHLIANLNRADVIYGHNILGFDLLALAHHHGADYDALAAKAVDTMVLERLIIPPMSKRMANGYYGLDAVAQRLGHAGKTDDLKGLAKRYGGFDKIPVDSREYQEYLRGDLAATKHVYETPRAELETDAMRAYAAREMKIAAIQNRMTLNGWAVDAPLLAERRQREDEQRAAAVRVLHEEFGMPVAAPDRFKLKLKAEWPHPWPIADVRALDGETQEREGFAVRIPGKVHDAPWATDAGREALVEAFRQNGAPHVPRTATGALALASDVLGEGDWYDKTSGTAKPGLLKVYGDRPGVRRIVEQLNLATGARAKYAEISKFVTEAGRVHAWIGDAQGSGRWAMTKPSITNMGIRGAAGEERAVLVADEGHLLLTCDLSQVDMRGMAGLSQDPAYMALFEPGRDAHSEMAVVYFGDASKENRQRTKAINHKLNYGGGAKSTAEMNGIPLDVVEHAMAVRAETYPRLVEYIQEVRDLAATGALLDNGFGRLMRPDPDRAWTQGPALVGQGAARDIMCESLLRLVAARPDVTPLLRGVVHDEIVLSVPADTVEEWAEELRRAFTWEWKGVPILCEVGTPAFRWSDCK